MLTHRPAPAPPGYSVAVLSASEWFGRLGSRCCSTVWLGRGRGGLRLDLRERVLRNVRLWLLVLVVRRALRESPRLRLLRNELVRITLVCVSIEVTMERLGLIEPAAAVHAGLPFHARHRHILSLSSQNDPVIVLRMLKIILGSDRVAR